MGMQKLLEDLAVEPRGVVYAGAHHGEHLPELLACGFSRLLLVEPNPGSFEILAPFESDRVRCVRAALADRMGPVTYFAAPGRLEILNSIFRPNEEHFRAVFARSHAPVAFETHEVPATTLDALLAEADRPAPGAYNVLYMNIQGAELAAVRGAQATLDGFDVIACEVDFVARYENGVLYDDLAAYLASRGFTAAGLWRSEDPENLYGTACFVRRPPSSSSTTSSLTT